jgi:Na+:H+ antiporter, NhaA family
VSHPNEERPRSLPREARNRAIPRLALRPLTEFLQTELAGSSLLLVATAAALLWVNSPWIYHEDTWHTQVTLGVAGYEISNDLRHWITAALMAVFFLVVGLELKRELLDGAERLTSERYS